MTPCEKLGYKVGDKFRLTTEGAKEVGESADVVLSLHDDDGSDCPEFYGSTIYEDELMYVELEHVYKLTTDFEVGDVVKVVRKTKRLDPHGMGFDRLWKNSWADGMDAYLDKELRIKYIHSLRGAALDGAVAFDFPLVSLQLVSRPSKAEVVVTPTELEVEPTPEPNLLEVFRQFANSCGDSYDVELIVKRDSYTLTFDHYEWNGDSTRMIDMMNLLRQLHISH